MPSTYEEIDAECERQAARLPSRCKALLTACMQHRAGLAIRALCAHCGGLIKATDLDLGSQGSAPFFACPCGRTKNFMHVP